MRQEINLLKTSPAIEAPKLSFKVASSVAIFLLVPLIGLAWHGNNQLDVIYADIATIERNNSLQKTEINTVNDINKHQTQLKALEKQLLSKYQLWVNYKKITSSGKNGFSKHFYHIANLATNNLSLYHIDIYDRGTRLALKGYSRKAEYIPAYINELKKQEEFNGISFGDLSIEKLKGHDVMRFSLSKEEMIGSKEKEIDDEVEKNIDISELLNMPLLGMSSSVSEKELVIANAKDLVCCK